jgi:hypothetical protein
VSERRTLAYERNWRGNPVIMRKYVYDIEVFPNLFMVAVKSLETKKVRVWYVSPLDGTNDFLEICSLFNNDSRMFIGYNSIHYDNQIMQYCLVNFGSLAALDPERLCWKIYQQSSRVIGGDKEYKYRQVFRSLDLMNVIRVGRNTKSLKMIAVNLKWPIIQDLPVSPTKALEDITFLSELERYNINDVNITEALYDHLDLTGKEEVGGLEMREKISNSYGIRAYEESDSGMGLLIFEKIYCQNAGVSKWDLKEQTTHRVSVKLGEIIAPNVKFRSPQMKKFLASLREEEVYQDKAKGRFKRQLRIGDTVYTMAQGGLHSEHSPELHTPPEGGRLIDADVTSYYPFIVINGQIAPAHLNREAFVHTMETMIADRVVAKRAGDDVKAYGLKIGANSCFGRFGFEGHWLCDLAALYGVTINGQLWLLMLIERLEEAGIQVFYANTDGITFRVNNKEEEELAMKICKSWERYTNFSLEYADFAKFYIRDVNNYLVVQTNGKIKRKGEYDQFQYKNPMKSFDCPVVARAVEEFFVNGVPVSKTIREGEVLDYCMAQKVGETYSGVIFEYVDPLAGEVRRRKLNRVNRYLVSTEGGALLKLKGKKKESMTGIAGETVLLVNDYKALLNRYPDGVPIRYEYYERRARSLIQPFETSQLTLFT